MISLGDMTPVQRLIGRFGKETEQLIEAALELSYLSNGSWSYHTVLNMTAGERSLATEFMREQLKREALAAAGKKA